MMSPTGFEHGVIVAHITRLLGDFVVRADLGVLTGAETGFQISSGPDTVRAPDVGFVRKDRVPPTPTPGYFPGAPDLAVEVLSPSDRASEVQKKVQDWIASGCRMVWVVDPATRTVTVYSAENPPLEFEESGQLTGGHVIPNLELTIADIFAR